MINAVYITGTDTGVGKTTVTGLLAKFLTKNGVKTITQKWVQTGTSGKKCYEDTVPYLFKFASSPHLAASLEGKRIRVEKIENSFKRLSKNFDFVIVEGTGGALVPISEKRLMIDIVRSLDLPVLIVVANRLGAINHTLLTVEALRKRDLKIVGILFNRLSQKEDELILKDNVQIIARLTGENILGELSHSTNKDSLYNSFGSIGKHLIQFLNF